MSEEEFKSIRITLSHEAFDRLEKIMKGAKFRSNSSTIEECIRVLYDIMKDITSVIGKRGDPDVTWTDADAKMVFRMIITRMERITGRRLVSPSEQERQKRK